MENHSPAPIEDASQELCVACGLCCDGTLFEWAGLALEDTPEQLRSSDIRCSQDSAQRRFDLPCHHHQQRRCTIYRAWRPRVCGSFKCQLLRRLESGEVSAEQALAIVEKTNQHAARIWAQLRAWVPDDRPQAMTQLYLAWEVHKADPGAADWVQHNEAFLLDYLALRRRLERLYFAKKEAALDS